MLAQGTFENKPFTRRYVDIKPFGGAVSRIEKEETAFWHRSAVWWLLSNQFFLNHHSKVDMAAIQASRGQQHEKFVKAMGGALRWLCISQFVTEKRP